jgi:hypothetical protein
MVPKEKVVKDMLCCDEEEIHRSIAIASQPLLPDYFKQDCVVCGHSSRRIMYWSMHNCCSSCSRKIARALKIAIQMKSYHRGQFSKGSRYGYTLATTDHAKDALVYLQLVIEDAQKHGKTVFMLGRDMDVFYHVFQLEDNVKYLSGWNRAFVQYASYVKKHELIEFYGIQDFDYIVDTGFYGSILMDINNYVSIHGFLLSADNENWNHLYRGHNYEFRDWVVKIEHTKRARQVDINSGRLPIEVYTEYNGAYEKGFFQGFKKGAEVIMQ